MVKRLALLLTFLILQGCATDPREVVVATIKPNGDWSIDTAQFMTYSDQFLGSVLLIQPEVDWKSGLPAKPLEFRVFMDTSFDLPVEFAFDTESVFLSVGTKTYKPSNIRRGCSTHEYSPPDSVIIIRKPDAKRHGTECVFISYAVPQPSDWSTVSLDIGGLSRNGKKITVPQVHFERKKLYFARCGTPAGNRGMFCINSTYYDRDL